MNATMERVKWTHQGHRFTIRKVPGSTFWYYAWREGKHWRKRSTFTQDRSLAKKFAQDHWQEWLDLKREGLTERKSDAPPKELATIAEILACYHAGIARVSEKIKPATIAKNSGALVRLGRWGGAMGDGKWKMARADILTAKLIDDAVTAYKVPAGQDARLMDQRRRGAAAMVRQARAVFKPEALGLYRESGLVLPDLTAFLKGRRVTAPLRVHRSLEVSALRRMDECVQKWRTALVAARSNGTDGKDVSMVSDLYLVHLCAKFLGLRANEIAAARRGWFLRAPDVTVDGRPWGQWFVDVSPTAEFRQKASEGAVPITKAVIAEFALALRHRPLANAERGTRNAGSSELLIASPARHDLIYKVHSKWLREFFPSGDFAKTNHELRRWGAQIMEGRYGKEAAEAFLRHTPKTAAERHYLERSYPWSRLGNDVGITLEDARGPAVVSAGEQVWRRGL